MMGKAEPGTTHDNRNPNWLLRGLVLLSIGIHALALAHMAGWGQRDPISYIELEMQTAEKLSGRSIPVPPRRQKAKPQLTDQAYKPLSAIPVVKPEMPHPAPQSNLGRPSVVEPIAAPQVPHLSTSAPIDWQPAAKAATSETASVGSSPAHGSAADYLGMVRLMIENHKRYPHAARQRRIQGQAVVRFVISADGAVTNVALAETSRHGILDKAALAAVKDAGPFPRPPEHLFNGPIPLQVCIVFELM
ncbi:MAG TPA: TonB family protein [Desulfobacterales bacterium]